MLWPKSVFQRWRHEKDNASFSTLLLSVLVLCLISFVMLWLGDKLNGQGLAITRYMARVQAPLTAQFYPENARQKITVIIYDEQFLKDGGYAWPLEYGEHAQWLLKLVENTASKPKAIFLDLTFGQTREDDTLPELAAALCQIQHKHGVPVFLAGLPSRITGQLYIREDLLSARSENGQPCFTLAGAVHLPDPVDGITWSYPLTLHLADNELAPGPAPRDDIPSLQSAAMAMAQQVANIDLGRETTPLALIWGSSTQKMAHPSEDWANCSPGEPAWKQLFPHVIREIVGRESVKLACPFHPTLSMAQINQLEEEELWPYLDDTYVVIGAAVDGYNDLAMSPVHGLIPGVYVHAMALDNLLVYQGRYKQHNEWTLPPTTGLFSAGIVAVFSVFVAHVLFRRVRRLWSHWLPINTPAAPAPTNFLPRLTRLIYSLCIWILRIWTQVIAALLMIIVLQQFFRIGMLPVVELIGMTVLAEGLGYLDKVRDFFAPSQPPAALRANPETVSPDAACPLDTTVKKEI